MRGRSSSNRGRISRERGSMENNKEEPHLSGAYIRSLVKHLTSARTKDPIFNGDQVVNKQPQPQHQHKKQVRRRQHTTRPYQERLLNMAEARREIVTALKFHRASMKQQQAAAAANNQLDQSLPPQPSSLRQQFSTSCPSTTTTTTTTASSAYNYYSGLPSLPYIAPPPLPLPPLYNENLNFKLPNQTLGLNLNFQDFENFNHPLSIYSPSSSPSSTSSSSSAAISVANESLHHAMDDEEMEEIRSLGEQHQMEWNDTVNFVMSARWFNFLNTMEIQKHDYNPFHQVIQFPHSFININEQHFSDDLCLQDPALPCMEIGEIEGMDWEWLSQKQN